MLEAIELLGKTVGGGDLIAGIIEDLKNIPKDPEEGFYLVKLDFREEEPGKLRLRLDFEEIPKNKEQRYEFLTRWRHVGNASGNNPQKFLTTNTLHYLTGQVIPNLLQELSSIGEEDSELARKLKIIYNKAFSRLEGGEAVLDLGRLGIAVEEKAAKEESKQGKKKAKERAKQVEEGLVKLVGQELGIKKKQVGLWTLLFNGEPLVQAEPYDQVILRYRLAGFEGEDLVPGTCLVCGKEKEKVSAVAFKRLKFFKPYITDKVGFASGVSELGFIRNFLICEECFRSFLVVENYLPQNLNLRVGTLNFLLLPTFILFSDSPTWREELPRFMNKLTRKTQAFTNLPIQGLEGEREFEEELERLLEDLFEEEGVEDQALLNFLFYQKTQSEFRILGLIKDVAPSRLSRLFRRSNLLAQEGRRLLGGKPKDWWIDLTRLYYLLPLRERDRAEHKKLLYLYQGLLRGEPIDYSFLVKEFLELAHLYLTGRFEGTNQRKPNSGQEERALATKLLHAGFLLKLLREEGILKGVKDLPGFEPSQDLMVNQEMREYLKSMNYSEPQAALFLLGYLLNEVGKGQYSSGHQSKPVLDKINYQGMNWSRVLSLANQLFEKLRQYDRLRGQNEVLYAEMKRLLDRYRDSKWPLGPEENVFYILSGYAYGTRTTVLKKEKEVE
ncbi:type I-B CRISPR-associated protein Cas8b/Csh1 [Ammonifex thiophilus]|uniref:Type I-B CRISPR-associated protein Cas8b/Csh1 n=1 Tax=Ammonifex thiophilus TaxID=444093 RepID=A0A3D8P574_9THEO|nr:type I-B CRISPR-associated protein Cas8b/Csh1 [Ammonifex thiophilus]RDV83597.1 type I-B CRISPR-associated protein Cas8b/Csh1 [Ammonifex thiophilus]